MSCRRSASATCSSTSPGSKDHNIALREDAQRRGLSISEYGVTTVETGEVVTHASEDELYEYLGYRTPAPELREGTAEIAAARDGELPALVEVGDLTGEMHCHSTWSTDARGTLEEMALTAKGRGYKFLCITDHSHYLRDGRLEAQWEEIDELNSRLKSFRVLKGIEANIRADGSLDVDDDDLAQLDWVVASLHTSFDRSPTERILGVMDNPHVDCIGHLTGRRLLKRAGARRRRRAGRRARGRDGNRARDQLAARPARHARHARATRGRGRAC